MVAINANRASSSRPYRMRGDVGTHTLLREGASGSEVRQLQRALSAAGIQVPQSGRFDAATSAAVRQYQQQKGLSVDGVVGQQTWGSFLGKSYPPGSNMLRGGRGAEAVAGAGGPRGGRAGGSAPVQQRDQFDDAPVGPGRRVNAYVNGQPRQISVVSVGNGQFMQANAARNFLAMQAAARRAGINLSATSGFRTMAQQQELYRRYQNGTGNLAARPGYSNHQNGISMDVGGVGGYGSAAYRWMSANAARYGFRNDVRGEPWHWTSNG